MHGAFLRNFSKQPQKRPVDHSRIPGNIVLHQIMAEPVVMYGNFLVFCHGFMKNAALPIRYGKIPVNQQGDLSSPLRLQSFHFP